MALVDATKDVTPEIAAPCVGQIADPAQRHRAITGLATRWLQSDRTAASVWLAQTDLPRDSMQALLADKPVPGGEAEEILFCN